VHSQVDACAARIAAARAQRRAPDTSVDAYEAHDAAARRAAPPPRQPIERPGPAVPLDLRARIFAADLADQRRAEAPPPSPPRREASVEGGLARLSRPFYADFPAGAVFVQPNPYMEDPEAGRRPRRLTAAQVTVTPNPRAPARPSAQTYLAPVSTHRYLTGISTPPLSPSRIPESGHDVVLSMRARAIVNRYNPSHVETYDYY
jgi:hypothetical protein